MAVAFTDADPVYVEFPATTSAELRGNVHTALQDAGWTTFTAITGGFLYQIASPQGLIAKVKIWDDGVTVGGLGPSVVFQFLTADETGAGYLHRIGYGTGRVYRIWANECQLFIAMPGVSSYSPGDAATKGLQHMCGGIPWVPQPGSMAGECASEYGSDEISAAFWSCGSGLASSDAAPSFRRGYRTTSNDEQEMGAGQAFSVSVNGMTWNSADTPVTTVPMASLRLLPPTPTGFIDWIVATPPRSIDWRDFPLYSDPLLSWGVHASQVGRLRGQIWDAVLAPWHTDKDLDEQFTIVSQDLVTGNFATMPVVKWGHFVDAAHPDSARGSFYCSLLLRVDNLTEPGGGMGNYVY